MTPVNSMITTADSEQMDRDPTAEPVSERMATWKKNVNTPQKPKISDPTELPLSERFAGWEQRVSQTPTTVSSKVPPTPKQMCTTPGPRQEQAKTNESVGEIFFLTLKAPPIICSRRQLKICRFFKNKNK